MTREAPNSYRWRHPCGEDERKRSRAASFWGEVRRSAIGLVLPLVDLSSAIRDNHEVRDDAHVALDAAHVDERGIEAGRSKAAKCKVRIPVREQRRIGEPPRIAAAHARLRTSEGMLVATLEVDVCGVGLRMHNEPKRPLSARLQPIHGSRRAWMRATVASRLEPLMCLTAGYLAVGQLSLPSFWTASVSAALDVVHEPRTIARPF